MFEFVQIIIVSVVQQGWAPADKEPRQKSKAYAFSTAVAIPFSDLLETM